MELSNIFTMTVGAALAWLASFGVSAAVAYVLGRFPQLNANIAKAISGIAMATLAALVTAIANALPQSFLDKTIFSALVAGITLMINWAGVLAGCPSAAAGSSAAGCRPALRG